MNSLTSQRNRDYIDILEEEDIEGESFERAMLHRKAPIKFSSMPRFVTTPIQASHVQSEVQLRNQAMVDRELKKLGNL